MNNFFNQINTNQKTSVPNTIQNFFNEAFGEVRGTIINGKPHVAGSDIARCLGYSDCNQAVRQHVSSHNKGTVKLTGPGGMQEMIVINEAGINELIFSSKMPKAKEIQQWIFSDVMPKLRQYGMYFDYPILQQYGENPEEAMKNIETVIVRQREENQRLQNTISEQEDRIKRMKPKEDMYNYLIHSAGFNNTTTVAEDYGMNVYEFNNLLANFGIQYKGWDRWYLYPQYEGYGLSTIQGGHDEFGVYFEFMAWTNKGRQFLYDFLKSKGILPKKHDNCPFGFVF